MDRQEEYHDPDYPGTSSSVKEEPQGSAEDETIEKIRSIIRREFTNDLEIRENEIMLIDQRMSNSRRMLSRLRYNLVTRYYQEQSLQLSSTQVQDEVAAQHEPRARAQVSALLRDGQRRIHPSVRKLLGKQAADLDEILFRSRVPRNKTRKDYCAMLQTRNYTIAADATKSLRPADLVVQQQSTSKPKKVPRHRQPKIVSVMTLDEATRNQMKHRYRIIIGNTSKYAPAASLADRSTHKWLLYVRGAPGAGGAGGEGGGAGVLRGVTVRLHHSYAPHHTVHLDKPPFHISRRGWGEFPARVELHFALPERNPPASLEHTIKLDRNYTGLQTLGAETVVDVWLYSTEEMLQYEYKENDEIQIKTETDTQPDTQTDTQTDTQAVIPKQEPVEPEQTNTVEESNLQNESWLDFFSKDTTELDVDEMIIKPVKKVDERNDLESLIETSVIPKQDIIENNHIDTNDIETGLNEVQNDFGVAKIKMEVDESCTDNYKSVDMQEDLPNELLIQPTSPKKRIMKYMDPTTGKIYYLEMDRKLDLTKVQEIVINSKGNVKTAKISPIKPNGLKNVRKISKKGGVSLLKPELKSLLNKKEEIKEPPIAKPNFTHIENDHCYLGSPWTKNVIENSIPYVPETNPPIDNSDLKVVVKKEKSLFGCLCSVMTRFTSVRSAVNYLLKKIPIICDSARDPDYVKWFPFVVETEERFWRLDFAKRRNIEWSRAKLINKLLTEHITTQHEPIWRTKQILIYSRLHGFHPTRTENIPKPTETNEWSSWTNLDRKLESNIKLYYPNASDITTLTKFNVEDYTNCLSESLDITDSDDDVEVVDDVPEVKKVVPQESSGVLTVLPVENEEDRLRFLYIERKCADIGVELRNEDVGNGYSYSAVHAVLLSAMKSFAEELVRSALAARQLDTATTPPPVWTGSWCGGVEAGVGAGGAGGAGGAVQLEQVWRGVRAARRLQALAAHALAAARHTHEPL